MSGGVSSFFITPSRVWIHCLVAFVLAWNCLGLSWNNTSDMLSILDNLLMTHDRRATPTHNLGIPTKVSVEMFLRSFGSINPATMDYEVDLYLRQSWKDERLSLDNLSHELDLNDPHLVQKIWKPEVFFPNAKEASFQMVTVPNVLLRLNPGGNILYMLRLKLTFSCMMDLTKYPLDSQVCSIELSSFAKTTKELMLMWSTEKPVKIIAGLKLPQFELQKIIPTDCVETFTIGEYSCLRANFLLERSVGYHLVQSYLPTTLIVIMSWVSFWLDIDAIPARVTLGVTTLLTISSESSGIRSNLPPVSYVKALDVWMGSCTIFVFATLIEFTVVNYLFRKKEMNHSRHNDECRNRSSASSTKSNATQLDTGNMITQEKSTENRCSKRRHESPNAINGSPDRRRASAKNILIAKRIDRVCRAAFPMVYVIFNIIYWTYYMT